MGAVGNIRSICALSGPCTTPSGAFDRVFGYDDINRLTTAKSGSSLWGSAAGNGYAYDPMGNMTSITLGTARTATFSYVGTTPKLSSVTETGPGTRSVTYDPAGNETGVGTSTFTYSARNLLSGSAGDGLLYTYDGRGLRVTSTRNNVLAYPTSLTISPFSALGGSANPTGTVILNYTGGAAVNLTSSDPTVASVPQTVTIPLGQTAGSFLITTSPVAADTKVLITAAYNGVTKMATVVVTAGAQLLGVSLSPRTVRGGNSSTGTVTLNGPAPGPSGAVVTLTSSSLSATVTSTVTIPQGQTSTTFTVTTLVVTSSTSAIITATYGTPPVSQRASLTIVTFAVQGTSMHDDVAATSTSEQPVLRLASLAGWLERPSVSLDSSPFRGWSFTASFQEDQRDVAADWDAALWPTTPADPDPGGARLLSTESLIQPLPARNFLYSPEFNLLAESELAPPRDRVILYEYIWFNGHPVAQIDGTTVVHWTFTDHLGTPLMQTTATQAVWWRAEYEPYGRVFAFNPPTLADQHQPLRLPGQEAEQLNLGTNGLTERSYNIFRWYRYGWGRYTQTDPLWDPRRTAELDPYAYVVGNPARFSDPVGLMCVCCNDWDKQHLSEWIGQQADLQHRYITGGDLPPSLRYGPGGDTTCDIYGRGVSGPGVPSTAYQDFGQGTCIDFCVRVHEQYHRNECRRKDYLDRLKQSWVQEAIGYAKGIDCLTTALTQGRVCRDVDPLGPTNYVQPPGPPRRLAR